MRGFTLIEMTVAVVVIALVAAMGIPAFVGAGTADVREASRRLSGLIRSTYEDAILNGETRRLMFTLPASVVKISASQGVVNLEPDKPILAQAEELKKDSEDKKTGVTDALFGMQDLVKDEAHFDETGEPFTLPSGTVVREIWIEGMDEPTKEGEVYLYFFRHGYTQNAIFYVATQEGEEYSVRIRSLTGRSIIEVGHAEWKRR